MASLDELKDALVNAHNAGDTGAATALADAIANFDTSAPPPKDVKAEFNAMPMWQKPFQAADDIVRKLADGATFGYADKLASYMGGTPLKDERQKTADASTRSGSAGDVAELGGMLTPAIAGVPSAMRAVPQGWGTLARMAMAGVAGGAEGAGYGSLSALGHDTNVEDGALSGAVGGAIGGPLVEGLSTGLGALWRRASGVNRTPSVDQLRDTKNAAYHDVETREAMVPPNRIVSAVNDLNTQLRGSPHNGVRVDRHPAANDMLNQLNDVASQTNGESLYNLDTLRQTVNEDVTSKGGSEGLFGNHMRQGLDNLLGDSTGVTVARGTPDEAVQSLLSARDANQAYRKTADISGVVRRADRRAASTGVGDTSGNQIRQNVRGILDSDTKSLGYTPEELALMERVVRGTRGGNAARKAAGVVGGFAGRSLAAGAGGTIGGFATGGSPTGLAMGGMAGLGASAGAESLLKSISERSSRRLTDDLLHLTATGRRLQTGKNPAGPMSRRSEAELERLLMLMGVPTGGNEN
jgi:hypothetical protein